MSTQSIIQAGRQAGRQAGSDRLMGSNLQKADSEMDRASERVDHSHQQDRKTRMSQQVDISK